MKIKISNKGRSISFKAENSKDGSNLMSLINVLSGKKEVESKETKEVPDEKAD